MTNPGRYRPAGSIRPDVQLGHSTPRDGKHPESPQMPSGTRLNRGDRRRGILSTAAPAGHRLCHTGDGQKAKVTSTITAGAALSLSGRFAVQGEQARRGLVLWAEHVNNQGGLALGPGAARRPVELRVYDDG